MHFGETTMEAQREIGDTTVVSRKKSKFLKEILNNANKNVGLSWDHIWHHAFVYIIKNKE